MGVHRAYPERFTLPPAKRGSPVGLPRSSAYANLEVEPQRKLQSAHAASTFYVCDPSVVGAHGGILAVNAIVCAVVSAECIDGVVKDIKRVHAELKPDLLRDGEVLHHREVGIESGWATKRIVGDVAEVPIAGICEGPTEGRQRGEVLNIRSSACGVLKRSRTHVEGSRTPVWPADAYLLRSPALVAGSRPRQTAAPVRGIRQFPTADQIVHGAARVAQVLFALAERQVVNRVEYKYLVANEVVGT